MAVLYGCRRSRASRNLWLQEEAGFELELRTVWQSYRLDDPDAPGAPMNTRSPEFRAIWPMGGIPVLVDGDLTLGESLAINLHLARTRGGALGPEGEEETARMEQWALFGATAIEAPALAISNVHGDGRLETPEGQAEVEAAKAKLERPLRALEAHLGTRLWMVGSRFTVADINMAEILRYAQGEKEFLALFPAVDGWLRTCQGREGFQRMWAKREAEPARPRIAP